MKEIALTIEETAQKAVKLVIPIVVVMVLLFVLLHGFRPFMNWSWVGAALFLGSVLAGVVLHELLHAAVLGAFARGGYRAIKFGMDKNTLTPYCHCTKPIRARWYRLAALAPLLVQGGFPFAVSLFTGNMAWWAYGLLFTVGASGDLLAIEMLAKIPGRTRVQDHPYKMGFYVMEPESTE